MDFQSPKAALSVVNWDCWLEAGAIRESLIFVTAHLG